MANNCAKLQRASTNIAGRAHELGLTELRKMAGSYLELSWFPAKMRDVDWKSYECACKLG